MRLTSEIWVKALVRRLFGDGAFAVIERQGIPEAGAVFIRVRHRDGLQTLLAPAPQSFFDSTKPPERRFERRLSMVTAEEVERILARETEFDPDLWIVEIETDGPGDYVDITPDEPEL